MLSVFGQGSVELIPKWDGVPGTRNKVRFVILNTSLTKLRP